MDLARRGVEEVDDGARRAEQAGRLVHDVLEQLRRVLDRHEPARDLAQRALRVGGVLERRLRGREAVDEAGVRERDRGLAGERVEQPDRVVAERVPVAVARLEHPEQAVLADDGRRDHRVQADLLDALVALLVVLEPVVDHVVAGRGRAAKADGEPREADGRLVGGRVEHGRVGERAAFRVGPEQRALHGLDEVESDALGVEEACGLVDDPVEQAARVAAEDREPAADLAQRPLLLRTPREGLPRPAELLDEASAAERHRGLAGDGLEQHCVVRAERPDLRRPHGDRPERALVAEQRRRDDGVDALVPDVRVGAVAVDDLRVLEIVGADVRAPGDDGPP